MNCLTEEQVEKLNKAYFDKVPIITGKDFPGRLELVEIILHVNVCSECHKRILKARKEIGEKSVGG